MPLEDFVAIGEPVALRIAAELSRALRLSLGAIGMPRGRG
jgi:hypothetical protein